MHGQYIAKVNGEPEKSKTSDIQLSSMEEVFDWYIKTIRVIPLSFSEESFEKTDSEWRLKKAEGDCESVILKLID